MVMTIGFLICWTRVAKVLYRRMTTIFYMAIPQRTRSHFGITYAMQIVRVTTKLCAALLRTTYMNIGNSGLKKSKIISNADTAGQSGKDVRG